MVHHGLSVNGVDSAAPLCCLPCAMPLLSLLAAGGPPSFLNETWESVFFGFSSSDRLQYRFKNINTKTFVPPLQVEVG